MKHIKLFEAYVDTELVNEINSLINWNLVKDLRDMALEYIDNGFTLDFNIGNAGGFLIYGLYFNHDKDYSYNILETTNWWDKKYIDKIRSRLLNTYLTYNVVLLNINSNPGFSETIELVNRLKEAYPNENIIESLPHYSNDYDYYIDDDDYGWRDLAESKRYYTNDEVWHDFADTLTGEIFDPFNINQQKEYDPRIKGKYWFFMNDGYGSIMCISIKNLSDKECKDIRNELGEIRNMVRGRHGVNYKVEMQYRFIESYPIVLPYLKKYDLVISINRPYKKHIKESVNIYPGDMHITPNERDVKDCFRDLEDEGYIIDCIIGSGISPNLNINIFRRTPKEKSFCYSDIKEVLLFAVPYLVEKYKFFGVSYQSIFRAAPSRKNPSGLFINYYKSENEIAEDVDFISFGIKLRK